MDNLADNNKISKIQFDCEFCGQKISVPVSSVGQKGHCPKCNNIVIVKRPLQAHETEPVSQKKIEFTFEEPPSRQAPKVLLETYAEKDFSNEAKSPEREYPWYIDIFLYPFSQAGVLILGLIIFFPKVLSLITELILFGLVKIFPPAIVIFIAIQLLNFLVALIFPLYFLWYLFQCILDSSEGRIRAPDTISKTPDIFDLLNGLFRMILCLSVFFVPCIGYYIAIHSFDRIFWLLVIYGNIFFPVGLISVIYADSIFGLNPLNIFSILHKTFLEYFVLIAVLSAAWLGIVKILSPLITGNYYYNIILEIIAVYLLTVTAHILGRFCWRNREKISW